MECMKLFHPKKLEKLFNTAFIEHMQSVPGCAGPLLLDETHELKKGLCYKERIKCEKCAFTSKRQPMYEEIPSTSRGAKAAAPNVAVQVGLSHTPAGNSDFAHILNTAGVPAPSLRGMQRTSNQVMEKLVAENNKDMRQIRQSIRQLNAFKGLQENSAIRVEADAQYNNSLFSGGNKTPFQPATQSVYSVSENETKTKRIIAVNIANKLCRMCGGKSVDTLSAQQANNANDSGQKLCPNCSATVSVGHTIGDESHMVKQCIPEVLTDLQIKYVTTDQDSQASSAFKECARSAGIQTIPAKLDDTRHLAQSQRRAANKMTFSSKMFPVFKGVTKDKMQARFSLDLSRRCQGEHAAALKKYGSETHSVVRHLSYTSDAIIDCYQGDHKLCLKWSFLCKGRGPKLLKYGEKNSIKLVMTEEDRDKVRTLIGARLGRQAILKTKLGTNTQKSEAVNSAYVRSVPKFKTFSRNIHGRIHSRVHLLNRGRCLSTLKKLKAIGIRVHHGTTVVRQLCALQKRVTNDKKRQSNIAYKMIRSQSAMKRFNLYDKLTKLKGEQRKTYCKGMLDPKAFSDHTYSK